MENFGKLCANTTIIIFSFIMNGLIISLLWGWFIVNTFNVDAISLLQGMGLYVVIMFLIITGLKIDLEKEQTPFKESVKKFFASAIMKGMVVLIGFIIQWFM